jgi:ribosome-associated protein
VTKPDRAAIEAIVRTAAQAAAEKKATDVMIIDVGQTIVVTDYFLIATGANDRQVHAIADEIEGVLREARMKPIGREGESELKWVLLDYGDFVVHVFQPQEREFYRLERLWGDADRLVLAPEIANITAATAASAPHDAEHAETE